MEWARTHGVGVEGSVLRGTMGGLARQDTARLARHTKAGRCESVLSRRDARCDRRRSPGAMGYLALAAAAVNVSQAILKSSSARKKLFHLGVEPRCDGGFTLGCGKAYR